STSNLEVPKEPQSIPAVPELLHPKNIENAELNIQGSSLCELIISRIRNGGDGPEVEVFPNVSEEEYDYILNAIGCDDNLVCKPSYNPNLKQLAATLPSPIHEAILVPLRTAMGIVIDSFTILDNYDISLPIHMAWMLDAPATADLPPSDQSYHLGIPDMLLTLQTRNADILPFWPFEISVSQSSEAAIAKLQRFGDQNDNVLAVTHIHIAEAQKHTLPTYEWAVEKGLDKRGIQMRELTCLEDGRFTSLSHTWCHPVTVTISTWIRPPGGRLDLKSRNSRHHATAICILYPNQDVQGLTKVQRIFQRTLERIRDAVVEHLRTEHAHNKELLDLLEVVKKWTPPTELLNWDKCVKELRAATKQTGFDRYRSWHRSFLKRAADENEDVSGGSRTSKRGRVA
ncbi:hypothetical protein BDR04DRAFT_1162135, partial [Suillus decipiens]